MRDLFDEFMEELQRRQRGEVAPDATRDPATADEELDAPDTDRPARATGATDDPPNSVDDGDADELAEPDDETPDRSARPTPLPGGAGRGRGGGDRGRPPRRRAGGPNDGATVSSRLGGAGRRILGIAIVIVFLLFLALAGSGLDLWTDAIWYRSVGFESVFWTRLNAQAVLFVGGLTIGLVVLLVSMWIAGRLSPPSEPGGRSSVSAFLERLSEAGGPGNDRGPFNTNFSGPGGRDRRPGPSGRDPGSRPRGAGPGGGVFGSGGGYGGLEVEDLPDLTPLGRWLLVGLIVLIAVGLGAGLANQWETILLWRNQTTFGTNPAQPVVDPVFGRDIGFFLFQLPFLRLIQGTINGLTLLALLVTGARYGLAALNGTFSFSTPIRLHLAVLGGIYLLSVAAGYQLDKFELVYSTQGVAAGVAYADENARFFAFDALTVIAALSGALLIGGAFTRLLWPLGLAIGAWLLAAVLLGGLYPQVVQRLNVLPNQFAQEQKYIINNINMTRLAYGLSTWEERDYSGAAPLTQESVDAESATFQNARLWDYRPLGATLDQIQTVRQYYDFTDVDTDRYTIDGAPRQVMLSARELNQERSDSSSWVNQRLTYTHGIGAVMVPVNEVTAEGLPQLLIRDLPPVSVAGVPAITQPRIYFGERPSDYVIVDARQPEFDYPTGGSSGTGDQGAPTSWAGDSGIRLDSTLSRLLFAARFRDLNLLISDQVTADSKLLMHRSIADRLSLVAPFLRFDSDPYLVIGDDGRLFYIQDAYTISDRFPNAQPFASNGLPNTSGLAGQSFNYVRNSVKVLVDAYDGQMTFYAADPTDPILRAYSGVFPNLFTPLDQLRPDLRLHLRVPEELFNVQTQVYATYHVTNPETFFRKADAWTVPTGGGSDQSLPTEAYYVEMRMPGEPGAEFLLLQPMVPAQRPNMIAWVAARMDAPNYGAVRVYRFPQDTSVRGPTQIEAQIDSDPIISSQKTLWNASGSKVVQGNLIVLPVQNSVVYIQPIYLQSTTSQFPAFQKIVVATSSKVVWGNSLADALGLLLAGGPAPGPTPTPGPTPSPGPSGSPGATATPAPTSTPTSSLGPIPPPPAGDLAALVAYANFHFEQAQLALRAGDFTRYGQELAAVQAALALMSGLVGPPAPLGAPAPSVVPAGSAAASPSP